MFASVPGRRARVAPSAKVYVRVLMLCEGVEWPLSRKFHGLAETMDEAIKYRLTTPHDGDVTSAVVLAGPTCDSADILYEKADYQLPVSLVSGDKVWILATGAYTTTYSAVGFNGFPPLASICI